MLKVRVITPDRVVFEGEAASVQYPGEDGLYGILPRHAAMITTVDAGVLRLKTGSEERRFFVSRGFCEVANNELRFAVDSGESAVEIDVERAKAAAERARELLQKRGSPSLDVARAEYSLRRALMRLLAKRASG